MRVLIACGGTGGHINPGLAIADIIKKKYPDTEFLFAGTPKGMESKLVPKAGYRLETIKVAGFQRKISLENIGRNAKALAYLATSGRRAKQIIEGFKPDIAIGTGGYAAGPVIRKAARMGIPTAIHEQNAYPGVTNKLLSKEVDYVMLTVEEALKFMDKSKFEYSVTGLPVRSNINTMSREEARKKLGIDDSFTILSFGGSLGAGCINETMTATIKWHVGKNLSINHIHGYGGMGRDTSDGPDELEYFRALLEDNYAPADEDDYEDEPFVQPEAKKSPFEDRKEDRKEDRHNKVVNIHATAQLKVVLVKPERFENASEIADHLREKRTVVLNLESTNKDVARRLLDFLSGVAYAGEGKIKKVSANTYIITPYSVDIMGDLIDELESSGLYL